MDDTPDFFTDGARIIFGVPGVSLIFLRSVPTLDDSEPARPPEAMAIVRMSPQMAQQVIALLSRSLETLEKQIAEAGPEAASIQQSVQTS